MKKLTIMALALATSLAGLSPVAAAPLAVPHVAPSAQTDIVQVQERRWIRRDRDYRRSDRRHGWYNGHRGYREHRRGYRRGNDGWWYPLAAFGAGAVIGGALSSQPSTRSSSGGDHYDWCASRYRTYRASDNTYVPRAGVRATCVSPYS